MYDGASTSAPISSIAYQKGSSAVTQRSPDLLSGGLVGGAQSPDGNARVEQRSRAEGLGIPAATSGNPERLQAPGVEVASRALTARGGSAPPTVCVYSATVFAPAPARACKAACCPIGRAARTGCWATQCPRARGGRHRPTQELGTMS